jgi:NAD(P)-dependent dehydrogenase (short-subunit alcohol dehydrogenase family)
MDKFGTIDILVNNAGLTWGAPTLEYPLDKWEKIFDVNVKGVWILSQQVARIMKEKGGGKMINISSIYGSRGSNEEEHPAVAYNPSKFAVEGLTKTLALKLARYKIYVNCIAPGFFKTDMMGHLFKPEMKQILDLTVSAIPLKMYGEEDDIKGLAVFLASKASNYITGGIFPVDGGFSAQ